MAAGSLVLEHAARSPSAPTAGLLLLMRFFRLTPLLPLFAAASFRTREFDGQTSAQIFGSISATYQY